ncbi:MAG: hypothetical protein HRU38_16695 [Saccharospirillaceae bacterium]|nr:hypothetical protein [Pseudomonadales bacterium]NRB80279.1 hypothetical protein [Saccharospirillaceae bacterium]
MNLLKSTFTTIAATCAVCMTLSAQAGQMGAQYTSDKQQFEGYSIELINNCGVDVPNISKLAYTIMQDEKNSLRGWSHIRKNNGSGEFSAVKLEDDDYKISKDHYQVDESCNNVKTQGAVLLKKHSDWDHQHANGFEPKFFDNRLMLSNIDKIVLDIKLHKEGTSIPTLKDLKNAYGDILTKEQLNTLDQGKANIAVTIFEAMALNQGTSSLNADKFIVIDQDQYFDQWIRITIDADKMNYYTEISYHATPANKDDYKDLAIKGLRLNPENHTGDVLRNFITDSWTKELPELFKELNISIKKIEIIVKDNSVTY